jgi:hypothetical protein
VKYGLTTNTLGERGYGGLRSLSPRPQRFAQSSAKQTKQSDKQSLHPVKGSGKQVFCGSNHGALLDKDSIGINHHFLERVGNDFDPLWIALGIKRRDWTKPVQEPK